jgi:hypothetical protein
MGVFELLDLASGNLVGSYDTQEEALSIVRNAYAAHGSVAIRDLALMSIDQDENQELVATDADLAHLALGPVIAS